MLFLKRNKYFSLLSLLCLLSIALCGCAVVGPPVSQQEIQAASDELKVKAVKYQIDSLTKVNNIGYRLLMKLPDEDKKGSFVFSGLLLSEIDPHLQRLYQITEDRGVVVVGVVDHSPAQQSGIIAGDVIKSIDGLPIHGLPDVAYVFNHKADNQQVELSLLGGGSEKKSVFRLGAKPLDVSFRMVDEQEVNAGASPNLIVVTYGLMRFAKNDDEIAVVLGHELAHIARGHHVKESGIGLISMITGIAAGIGANKVSPGSADAVTRAVSSAFNARFSQDFEREADYFGLKYAFAAGFDSDAGVSVWERFAIEIPESMTRNFFSSHPSSPERMARLQKIAQELKSQSGPLGSKQ
ncbi:MAG: hypothetical protein A2Y01_02435 [Omnitrophica WOR_2 bacterium GWC2_44_8]|nr:MAG: hypothetical protein A2Y01_02435 [Omnitrophica WOR_2 bacterium GWC2_44_8]